MTKDPFQNKNKNNFLLGKKKSFIFTLRIPHLRKNENGLCIITMCLGNFGSWLIHA